MTELRKQRRQVVQSAKEEIAQFWSQRKGSSTKRPKGPSQAPAEVFIVVELVKFSDPIACHERLSSLIDCTGED